MIPIELIIFVVLFWLAGPGVAIFVAVVWIIALMLKLGDY
jgi:hypothetical protein